MKTQNKHYPLDIVIVCGGMSFDGDTIKTKSLGGSETACLQMAKALKKKGNNVTVFSDCGKSHGKSFDGVKYMDIQGFLSYGINIPHDVLIIQRRPDLFTYRYNSKINILWQHDLSIIRGADNFRGPSWNINKCFVMSEFQKKQSMEVNGMPEDYYYVTKNGLDLDIWKNKKKLKRDPKKLMFAARPERGLDILLFNILPELLKRDPEIKLYLAGYDHDVPEMRDYYNTLIQEAKKYPKNVFMLGCLSKKELYKHYQTASLYTYWTEFLEIFCITAAECMVNGLPFISRDWGALKETVHPDAGVLLSGFENARSPEAINQFVDLVINLINDPEERERMGKAGIEHAKTLNWDLIADEWMNEFYRIFQENTSNKFRLAQHFLFQSDPISVNKLLPEITNEREREIILDELKNWDETLAGEQSIEDLEDDILDESISDVGGWSNMSSIIHNKTEPHWPMLDQWFAAHPEVKNIMDYGCFVGRYSIPLANKDPKYKVFAVDISKKTLEYAERFYKEDAKYNNIEFLYGTHRNINPEEKMDCILMFDVLEHADNPAEMINDLEKFAKDDAWFLIITPYGALESNGYGRENARTRTHLHKLSSRDLKDLFSKKKNFQLVYMPDAGICEKDKSPLGKHFTSYQKSNVSTGEINYDRKLLVQSPKETVSLCMIAKNEENNIGKCLTNAKKYVDEMIVCDTGSIDRTKEIAKEYGAKVIEGSDPLVHGFETARNDSIEKAVGDWIMWLDADELLLQGENIAKYLRNNIFKGYSIRQHHLSVSPPNVFKPDLPVRLFRNRRGVKFFGAVHEHPELNINEGVGISTVLCDVEIAHGGYWTEPIRRRRFERNYPLLMKDRQKYPHRILGQFFEIRDCVHLARYLLERNGRKLNQEIVSYCQKAIDMYREHFIGKDMMVSGDAIQYYSEALKILGQGFEVSWLINFDKFQAKLNGNQPRTIRFLNQEDCNQYFKHCIDMNTKQFNSKYY